MFPLIGSLVGAGASLLGSFLSSESSADAAAAQNQLIATQNDLQRQATAAANAAQLEYTAANNQANREGQLAAQAIASEQFDRTSEFAQQQWLANQAQAARNEDWQRTLATMGIRMRVNDAIAAGLHPLYALGAPSMSSPTISIGNVSGPGAHVVAPARGDAPSQFAPASQMGPVSAGDTSIGRGLAAAGQDINRAIQAAATMNDRFDAMQKAQILERGDLENQLLRSKLAAAGAGQGNPAMADPDKDPFGWMQKPNKNDPQFDPVNPGQEQGAVPTITWGRLPNNLEGGNSYMIGPSKAWKERIEDMNTHEKAHFYKTVIAPALQSGAIPPPHPARPGYRWSFDASTLSVNEVREDRSGTGSGPNFIQRFYGGD